MNVKKNRPAFAVHRKLTLSARRRLMLFTAALLVPVLLITGFPLLYNTASFNEVQSYVPHSLFVTRKLQCLANSTVSPLLPQPDLPTLLHLPTMTEHRNETTYDEIEEQAELAACQNPTSLLALYRSIPSSCAVQPYVPHLRRAAAAFRDNNIPHALAAVAAYQDTLTIDYDHTKSISPDIEKSVLDLVKIHARVVLLVRSPSLDLQSDSFAAFLRSNNIVFLPAHVRTEEDAVIFASHAANILVHTGLLSALMALICEGRVYFTTGLHTMTALGSYRYAIKNGTLVPENFHAIWPEQAWALRAVQPRPSCCVFDSYGRNPVELKQICSNMEGYAEDPCWVLSVGSNNNWEFEDEIITRTKCKVHTFDCTGDWEVPAHLKGRVWLHKICVSTRGDPRPDYISLAEMMEFSSKQLGLPKTTRPTIAKIDAEGFEYASMLELITKDRDLMPDQIAIELHMILPHKAAPPMVEVPYNDNANVSILDVTGATHFLGNMSAGGYELVNKHDNIGCPASCAEFSFVRREKLPPVV